ncbi:MAG: phosphoglucosamine mutase [Elusimicrobia bacterium CG1_02_63_36]|nr:MAG: phosphoglucosamine mutase [Elusimicrobia bacterium CG1_02_63_36]
MSAPSLFGTDGIRGIPGEGALTTAMIRRIGAASARVLLKSYGPRRNTTAPFVLVGRDTRGSGKKILKSVARGFADAGLRTIDAGVLPTPAIAYLSPRRGAAAGVVISASHNPPEFNGIKFFRPDGFKACGEFERAVEAAVVRVKDPGDGSVSVEKAGRTVEDYLDFLKSAFPADLDLTGLKIALDAANGAASPIAARLFEDLGARVYPIGDAPNGANINRNCGATAPEAMQKEVLRRRAHCGIALDGDADRCVLADEKGRLLDGDALIALSALELKREGLLNGDRVVVTVMSNLGMIKFLEENGIGRVEVPVGDRNVTDALVAHDLILGGENSGHVVFRRFAPTGDGLLTALQTLAAWLRRTGPLSRIRSLYRPYPQILSNVRIARRVPLEGLADFNRELERAEKDLKDSGRVFVRYSGTEPVLRILAEGPDAALVRRIIEDLGRTFQQEANRTQEGV